MTKLATRSNKLSGVLAWELEPDSGVCRETVTVTFETGMDVGAAVMANLTSGVGAATANSGNTGNATFSAITAAAYASVGTYKVVHTGATAFNIYAPSGALVGVGATGTATNPLNAGGLTFTLTAGGTAAVAGDSYTIAVSGTVKYAWIEAADVATLNADVGMVVTAAQEFLSMTTATDYSMSILKKGEAKIVGSKLAYKDTLTTNQKNTVLAAFKAKDILNTVAV
jgi:hypothetical protein